VFVDRGEEMAYYFNGVKCDTLAELTALQKQAAAAKPTPSTVPYRTGRYSDGYDGYRVRGHLSGCDCDKCEDRISSHMASSFAG